MKHGLLIKPRDTDYVLGSSPLTLKSVMPTGDWTPHFWFNENQRNPIFDTDGCACYDANKVLDAWMDFLMPSLPASVAEQLAPFMDADSIDGKPHFHSSPRFTENLTGNGQNGNSIPECFDVIRKYGAVPYTSLPFTTTMTPEEYFAAVPRNILDMGAQFLALMGGKNFLQYHWLWNDSPKNFALMEQGILQSPLSVGIAVDDAGWNQTIPVDPPAAQGPQHALSLPKLVPPSAQASDNYIPYTKFLDAGYPINYCLQAVVSFIAPIEQQIVTDTAQVVQEVATTPMPANQMAQFLAELKVVIQKFESIL